MTASFARLTPEPEFEFLPAARLVPALHQTTTKPKIAATARMVEPPLRRRALLPAQAADELKCGALTEPRTTT